MVSPAIVFDPVTLVRGAGVVNPLPQEWDAALEANRATLTACELRSRAMEEKIRERSRLFERAADFFEVEVEDVQMAFRFTELQVSF